MSELGKLFADLPTSLTTELVEILAETDSNRIERIVSTGQSRTVRRLLAVVRR